MPRLLVDGTALTDCPKGVGRYAWHLINQLAERLPADWEIMVFVSSKKFLGFNHDRLIFLQIPRSPEILRGAIIIPWLLNRFQPHVLLSPNESILLSLVPVRRILVLHDLNELIWCHQFSANRPVRKTLNRLLQLLRVQGIRNTDIVVCNSNWVREAAIASYGLKVNNLRIGYCGLDRRFLAVDKSEATAPVSLPTCWDGYVLAFATGDQRENYELLPDIWAKFVVSRHDRGLIVAGVNLAAEYTQELQRRFRAYGLFEGEHYRFLGFLGDRDFDTLVRLYAAADYYLELSAHEGFGMQLAEALAVGTTCLSSGRGALDEVGGGFPIPIDVNDVDGIAQQLLNSYQAGLERRDNTPQREFVQRYSWDAVGETVAAEIMALAFRRSKTRWDEFRENDSW